MTYKIAVGGIHIESSTFTPYISGYRDFKIREGKTLLQRYPWYEKYKEKVELLPLTHAAALPGGVVDRTFFDEWLGRFKTFLIEYQKKGRIDGVLFDIHGAMSVQGMKDAEGYIAKELREIVGEETLISTSMDLHGNVSDLLFDATDLITCYRTAPHIDTVETRERAFVNLIKALDFRNKRLYKSKTIVPILLPGEKTSTEVSPGKELYESIPNLCDGEEVMDVAIWMGFPWADEERCHGVVTAVGFDEEKVEEACQKVAQNFFEVREKFQFVGPTASLSKAVQTALCFEGKPFFVSDTGDNPGAGGVGDMNLVLKEFLKAVREGSDEKKVLFASIFDPESIEAIYKQKEEDGKDMIPLELGGKMDLSFGGPLSVMGNILHLFKEERAGRGALIGVGRLHIIITENRFQYGEEKSFLFSGIKSLNDYDIIVVKMGYLEPDLSRAAKGWVMALTPGAVSQDLLSLPYKNRHRPLYPFERFEKNT